MKNRLRTVEAENP